MSEKDELIETITEIVREECIATGRGEDGRDSGELRDDLRDLIDAAVAPLVNILQDIADAVENSDRSLLDRAIAQIPQHLAAWRK